MDASKSIESEATSFRPVESILTSIQLVQLKKDGSVQDYGPTTFEREISTDTPYHKGDYQETLKWRTEITEKDMVYLPAEIQRWVQKLLKQGVSPVNIVDFGAATAKTSVYTADRMKGLIKEGKVKIIATNYHASPEEKDVEDLKYNPSRYFGINSPDYILEPDHLKLLQQAIHEKTVTFLRAGVLDLYEFMNGQPIHLMFRMNLQAPYHYDATLKIISEMMDPNYGTLIMSLDTPPPFYKLDPAIESLYEFKALQEGLKSLEEKGFKDEWTMGRDLRIGKGSIGVYQASKAPKFYLWDSKERQREVRSDSLQRFIPNFMRK